MHLTKQKLAELIESGDFADIDTEIKFRGKQLRPKRKYKRDKRERREKRKRKRGM